MLVAAIRTIDSTRRVDRTHPGSSGMFHHVISSLHGRQWLCNEAGLSWGADGDQVSQVSTKEM